MLPDPLQCHPLVLDAVVARTCASKRQHGLARAIMGQHVSAWLYGSAWVSMSQQGSIAVVAHTFGRPMHVLLEFAGT